MHRRLKEENLTVVNACAPTLSSQEDETFNTCLDMVLPSIPKEIKVIQLQLPVLASYIIFG